ncbi:MAG: hypothetical protein AB7N91_23275 [Candidatus Tectimicrobiota bacterium]
MHEAEIAERLHLLQQELILTGESLETMRRDARAALDALRLDIEVLRRCFLQLHPDFAGQYAATRAQLMQAIDPEATASQEEGV